MPERGLQPNSVRHEKRRGLFSLSPREERAGRELERGETDEKHSGRFCLSPCEKRAPFYEPSRLRVADPRSGPRLCEAQRFMVPMRAQKRMEALHEPYSQVIGNEQNNRDRFMASIHVRILEVFPIHEPPLSRPAATLSPPCG